MNDEKRVFDVTGPQATPTSRPIIVGHHPTMADPMMKRPPAPVVNRRLSNAPPPTEPESHLAKIVPVSTEIKESIEKAKQPLAGLDISTLNQPASTTVQASPPTETTAAEVTPSATPTPAPAQAPAEVPESQSPPPAIASQASPPETIATVTTVAPTEPHLQPVPVSHMQGSGRIKLFIIWLLVVALLTAIGLYLLIDAGVISSGINLPIHIINSK